MEIRSKKGFFFSTDAILALGIFVVAIILIIQLRPAPSAIEYETILADDIMIALSSIKVSESQSPTIKAMISNEELTQSQMGISLAELVSELWSEDQAQKAEQILSEIISSLPNSFKVSFTINQEDLYEFNDINSLRTIAKSTRLVSGINKSQPSRGYSANLFFTSAGRRSTSEYVYFDGLTGMGNIAAYVFLPSESSVHRITMEVSAASEFELLINGNSCGIYDPPNSDNTIRADVFEVQESETCNFTSIFTEGQNALQFRFTTDDLQRRYFSGGFARIFYVSEHENTHLRSYHDGLVTERIYINGVDKLVNIFSGFYFPGDITDMKVHLHFENQAPDNNPIYLRIADKIVYNTKVRGEIAVTLDNATLSSYMPYGFISGTTVPYRLGHLESITINDTKGSADAMITVESSESMVKKGGGCDFPHDGSIASICDNPNILERLHASQIATEALAVSFLNHTGNRMGIVAYHAIVPPGQVLGLTDDIEAVNYSIWNIVGQTSPLCFTCAIRSSATELRTNSDPTKRRAILLMSDGYTNRCRSSPTACGEANALQEAISEACNIWEQDKITIYTVGYGSGADSEGLRNISEGCTDGQHFDAQNLTELINIYINISTMIDSLFYQDQIPLVEGNVNSKLFPTSYIEATYIPYHHEKFGLLTITGQTPGFTNQGTTGSLSVSNPDMIREASVLSYSADKWTKSISINAMPFYDIEDYGLNYTQIGDPFRINVPIGMVQPGTNTFHLELTNISYASPDNKITYTAYMNNSVNAYSTVVRKGDGCLWHVEQEDGNVFQIRIPSSYSGAKICSYQNATYDTEDAYDISAYALLSQLDIDNNGLVDIYLADQDLTIESSIIEDVPSLWGPALFEVRVGR
jgi:hypothetical protein